MSVEVCSAFWKYLPSIFNIVNFYNKWSDWRDMVSRSTWINVGDSSLRLLLPMQTMQTLHNHKSLQTFKLVKILREPNLNKSIGVSRVSDNNYIYCMFPLDYQYYRITIGSQQANRVEIWKKKFLSFFTLFFPGPR